VRKGASRRDHTICTAVAPDAVFTVRTYGTGPLYSPPHATASVTMDLYGHLVDGNLWQAAQMVGGISGAFEPPARRDEAAVESEAD